MVVFLMVIDPLVYKDKVKKFYFLPLRSRMLPTPTSFEKNHHLYISVVQSPRLTPPKSRVLTKKQLGYICIAE